jgi:methionyl-tRNA formyltransferase
MLKKKSGELDFSQTAAVLSLKVRAYSPWPGAFTRWDGKRLLIHQASHLAVTSPGPGVFIKHEGHPAIGTSEGILVLDRLQLAGKRPISGVEFLNGTPSWGNETIE